MSAQPDSWQAEAAQFLEQTFLPRLKGQSFLVEEFVRAAERHEVRFPVGRNVMGSFILAAERSGLVRKSGQRKDRYSTWKTVWAKAR